MKIKCPCCQAENKKKVIYFKQECPALNNVVYKTKVEASNCSVGNVELVHCPECQFVYNCRYDGKLLKYDQDYNSVRNFSSTYRAYLDHLVKLCSIGIDKYKRVLEIGCGDGEFLKKFCSETGACGFGYDDSYHGEENYKDNVVFHKEVFIPSNKYDPFDAVFLRHILEHIPNPFHFLKELCQSDEILPGAKLWIEVPDFEWIVKNGVFYDITYEHCNYFTKHALANLLNKLGFAIRSFKNVFDGQYLLVEGIFQQEEFTDQKIDAYSLTIQNIDRGFEGNKKRFQKLVAEGESVCVWGASGKGVIFLSELDDTMLRKIKYVVDINREKQGKFLPVTAKEIKPPESLKGIDSSLSVLIMNGMYSQEIQQTLQSMNINFQTHVI